MKTTRYSGRTRRVRTHASTPTDMDPYDSFSSFDKLLFQRFSASVAAEMGTDSSPQNYGQLMNLINQMTTTRSTTKVHDQGKNMLVRLFPKWLLKQYQWMFAAPFPRFSAWMNAYVTHWTTNWLMGNSTVRPSFHLSIHIFVTFLHTHLHTFYSSFIPSVPFFSFDCNFPPFFSLLHPDL